MAVFLLFDLMVQADYINRRFIILNAPEAEIMLFYAALLIPAAIFTTNVEAQEMKWHDGVTLGMEGQGWTDIDSPYNRLPTRANGVVPESVWWLSTNSAGICLYFRTDSPQITVRWTLKSDGLSMPHMPSTGMSGVDLYAQNPAATNPHNKWRWVATGTPAGKENEANFGVPAGMREYILNLPLYNGVEKLSVGISADATIEAAARTEKPVVIYGTSITQGGCAARPGMAHTSIISRWLDTPVVNLGFSGSGRMEPEMMKLIAELDASVFVLDCLPNLSPAEVTERIIPGVKTLRAAHPDTPIILVENIEYQSGWLNEGSRNDYVSKNNNLKAEYEKLLAQGVTGLSYIEGLPLLGDDAEGTVDGVHPTDLGFIRMAEAFEPVIKAALGR